MDDHRTSPWPWIDNWDAKSAGQSSVEEDHLKTEAVSQVNCSEKSPAGSDLDVYLSLNFYCILLPRNDRLILKFALR